MSHSRSCLWDRYSLHSANPCFRLALELAGRVKNFLAIGKKKKDTEVLTVRNRGLVILVKCVHYDIFRPQYFYFWYQKQLFKNQSSFQLLKLIIHRFLLRSEVLWLCLGSVLIGSTAFALTL